MSKPKVLTNWAVCKGRIDPYKPPEASHIFLAGTCNGKNITTSHVTDIVAPRLYRTRSGSLYRLEGDPEAGYVEFCKEKNIALDLADPIKLIATTGAAAQVTT